MPVSDLRPTTPADDPPRATPFPMHLRAAALAAESGFTMIVVLGVLLVSSLLLIAAFTAANGDISLSHRDSTAKQAYYAALAGVQQYEYRLQANPNYWEGCESQSGTLEEEPVERYEVKPLLSEAATSKYGITECTATKPFESLIEPTGAAANTFRVESTGYAGSSKHSIVATFQVTGFLNYVYFTQYETEDPTLYKAESGCAEKYYASRPQNCTVIQFTSGDEVNGPMHTDDAADVCGEATFGRKGHSPPDVVEILGGTYSYGGCYGTPTYYTKTGTYSTKGPELKPPESDSSLNRYVESKYRFTGVTHIVLKGETIEVTREGGTPEDMEWPPNGLIYVTSSGCTYKFNQEEADSEEEQKKSAGCGNVYVSGNYSKPLTVGAENDVIINGNIYPTGITLGAQPTGTVTMGLIANEYVRVYHPVEKRCWQEWNWWKQRYETRCEGGVNGPGSLKNPWIYTAILSTRNSFVVDNYNRGEGLGELNVYGAIAQKYRGIVGTGGGGSYTGYIKDYRYDERLAVDEPPFFLSPLNAGWKVARETTVPSG